MGEVGGRDIMDTKQEAGQEEQTKEEVVVENEVEEEDEEIPFIDLSKHFIKPDMFDGIHILDETFQKVEGAPNLRQISGFPVFGTGQPTEEAMVEIINKAKSGKENEKIFWFTMRQEPLVYVNGQPYAPRDPENPHVNLEIKMTVDQIEIVDRHLAKILKKRQTESGNNTIKIHRDEEFAENPMDRVDIEDTITVDNIKSLEAVYEYCKEKCKVDIVVVRIPNQEDQMPVESMDMIIDALKDEQASTPCIFNCQMGKGRTTLGMMVASLIKEISITAELRKMEEINLIHPSTVKDLLYSKFERLPVETQEEEDPFSRGEFEVIKELCAAMPSASEAKRKIDIIIDKCGPPPKGAGIQNLRECIIQTKWKYDVAPEDKQIAYKAMIINFIERYFYTICFAMYALEFGPQGYPKTFNEWLQEKKELETMIMAGRDKLEWSRTVDAVKLEKLKEMMADPNYKDNMASLIRTIYEFAFQTYSDLPRGPIKNNSMKKLCASTLSEILPQEIADKVNNKIENNPNTSHDFLSLVGMVSYF